VVGATSSEDLSATYLERLNERPQQDADRVALTQQFYKSGGTKQPQKTETDEAILKQ